MFRLSPKKIIKGKLFFIILPLLLLVILYFAFNNIVIGGGDTSLSYYSVKRSLFYTLGVWVDLFGLGFPGGGTTSFFPQFLLFNVFNNPRITYTVLYFFYILSTIYSVYFFCRSLSLNKFISLGTASFYFLNLFSASAVWYGGGFISPAFYSSNLLLVGTFIFIWKKKKLIFHDKLLVLVNSLLIIFNATYNNLGNVFSSIIFIFLFFAYHFIILENRFLLVKRTILYGLLFILLNLFWFVPQVYNLADASDLLAKLSIESNSFKRILSIQSSSVLDNFRLSSVSTLKGGVSGNDYYPWFNNYYDTPLYILLSFLIPLIGIASIFTRYKQKPLILFLILLYTLFIFLCKGSTYPGGSIYVLFIGLLGETISNSFRNPVSKFGIYPVMIIGLLFFYSINEILIAVKSDRIKKLLIILVAVILLIYSYPIYSFKIFDQQAGGSIPSNKIKIPDDYRKRSYFFIIQKLDYRILPIPISKGYNTFLTWYAGVIPDPYIFQRSTYTSLYNVKPVIDPIYSYVLKSGGGSDILFSLINFKYYILHKDLNLLYKDENIPDVSYGKYEKLFFLEKSPILNSKNFNIYHINPNYFLPHVYSSQSIVVVNSSVNDLPEIISQSVYNVRSSIFFEGQNKRKMDILNVLKSLKLDDENNKQVLEFKKINPTKYRVVVHQAKGAFPLVFSESFHEGWKAYLAKPNTRSKIKVQSSKLEEYKILDGNEEDQASKEELGNFIENGWVSTLGDGKERQIKHLKYENGSEKPDYTEKYKIDFVSKNFQGTIQNDNLPSGSIFETWLASTQNPNSNPPAGGQITNKFQIPIPKSLINKNVLQIPDEKHLTVNGYANSWIIDPDEVCKVEGSKVIKSKETNGFCKKNADGSFDFEMVVEFWPQRLFYIGLFISGSTLMGCVFYLGYTYFRRKKSQGLAPTNIN